MNLFAGTFLTIFILILKLVKPGGAKEVIAENLMRDIAKSWGFLRRVA